MNMDKLFLLATLLIMLVNIIGMEGLRRNFRLARGKEPSSRDLFFVRTLLPWVVRLEFLYYLLLAAFAIAKPGRFPIAIVFFLVLYHAAGFVLSEKYAIYKQLEDYRSYVRRASSPKQLLILRIISFLDGFEMVLLVYLCLILIRRI